MEGFNEDLESNINNLQQLLQAIQTHIQPLQEFQSLSQVSSQLTHQDSLNLNAALAYSLHSLYYISLKLKGEDVNQHPILKEIQNIKRYVQKVQTIPQEEKRSVRIDANQNGPSRILKGSTPLPIASHLGWKKQNQDLLSKKRNQ